MINRPGLIASGIWRAAAAAGGIAKYELYGTPEEPDPHLPKICNVYIFTRKVE